MPGRRTAAGSRLRETAAAVDAGRRSVAGLLDDTEERLHATESAINAWTRVTLARARRDAARPAATGALRGVCVGLKDTIDVAGCPTTGSSRALADNVPTRDSTVWRRLRAAGALLVGKQECHELGSGMTTPQTANPWHLERSPGGSSGGSAAAVAAGVVPAAVGTDAGGSVRLPAALCGLAALRPSGGRISRHGVLQRSPSLGTVGPIARTVADCAVLLQVLAGADAGDAATLRLGPVPRYPVEPGDVADLRLGVPSDVWEVAAPEVAGACEKALGILERAGVRLESVTPPAAGEQLTEQLVPLLLAEFSEQVLRRPWRVEAMGWHVRQQVERGRTVGTDRLDELRARRREYASGWRARLESAGLCGAVFPTSPITAPYRELGGTGSGVSARLRRFVSMASWADLPELTFPVGPAAGLPVGLSVMGAARTEVDVLRVGLAYQAVTEAHLATPTP